MTDDTVTVWVSKYALTEGVYQDVGVERSYSFTGKKWHVYGKPGRDWHRTEAEAIADAEERRTKKIASLGKQIAKLRALKFEPTAGET